MKRLFDIMFSLGGIIILSPIFILIWVIIKLDSDGNPMFKQMRAGKDNRDFGLLKFRTMQIGADKKGSLTVGGRDPRITVVGYYLRKFKLDELPQLFNVLIGDMSFVGPRPELRKYVSLYTSEQLKVLQIRPGITDYASIKYYNENEILGKSEKPEQDYIKIIMPEKLRLNLEYLNNSSTLKDISIIFKTLARILGLK